MKITIPENERPICVVEAAGFNLRCVILGARYAYGRVDWRVRPAHDVSAPSVWVGEARITWPDGRPEWAEGWRAVKKFTQSSEAVTV